MQKIIFYLKILIDVIKQSFCFVCDSIEVAVCFVGNCDTRLPADQTKFYFFYGPTYFDRRIYNYNELDEILQHEQYDANKTTVLYIHGYLESAESDSVRLIVNAYHTRNEHNLIVLDWGDAAYGDYFITAVPNSIMVSSAVISIKSFVILPPLSLTHCWYNSILAWQHSIDGRA